MLENATTLNFQAPVDGEIVGGQYEVKAEVYINKYCMEIFEELFVCLVNTIVCYGLLITVWFLLNEYRQIS